MKLQKPKVNFAGEAVMQEQTIFTEALELVDPVERAAFLERACGGDLALRERVEKLLHRHQQDDSFLQSPAVAPAMTGEYTPDPAGKPAATGPMEGPGSVIGPYKLLQQIGEGGMGTVYMAEQTEPVRRKVALKIIKPGMDSRQVIGRFESERQALALMDHPNIARVLDAGTTETGRPYFVMELVKGEPITKFCDERRLPPKERLELFIPVCQAVQHAHQKGIIHRDLKPSNVLVALYDDKPVPKVIDFGIAKATGQQLTERTLFTEFGQIVGTLEYMSPEQAGLNQLDIDTRSDIYSLGVILYELLTGTTPLEKKRLNEGALLEVLRMIREDEPPRPSTRLSTAEGLPSIAVNRGLEPNKLSGLVRGDLDWVVMKALEKDRARRYETANALAVDIQRHLADEPVQACPPSALYRLRKFARRNRVALAVASVVLTALAVTLGVLAVSSVLLHQEKQDKLQALGEKLQKEEQRANAEAGRVKALDKWRQTAHYLRLGLVQNEYRANRIAVADKLLDECDTDLRDWEWRYLKRLCNSAADQVAVGKWLGTPIFSKDAGRVAMIEDGVVRVRETTTGKEVRSYPDKDIAVHGMAFSQDGRHLALCGNGGKTNLVKIREVETGKELAVLDGLNIYKGLACVVFSPNGERVAAADQRGNVFAWDWAAGKQLFKVVAHVYPNAPPNGYWFTQAAFNDDGSQLCTASQGDTVVKVWDIQTGNTIQSAGPITGHSQVYLGPKRTLLATTGTHLTRQPDLTIRLWDAKTGRLLQVFPGHSRPVNCVAFSSDERLLATGSWDNSVIVWEVATGFEVGTFRGGSFRDTGPSGVTGVAFTSDNKQVLALSQNGALRKWDVTHAPEVQTLRSRSVMAGTFSPDGRRVAASAALEREKDKWPVVVWDLATGQEVRTFGERFESPRHVVYSPDGRFLAAAMIKNDVGIVRIWDVTTGATARVFPAEGEKPIGPCIVAAYSPDGKLLAAAGGDRLVHVWGTATGVEKFTLTGHSCTVSGLAFSADNRRLVSGTGGKYLQSDTDDHDNDVKVWDMESGVELFNFKAKRGEGLALSNDGEVVTFHATGGARLFEVATGKEIDFTSNRRPDGQFLALSPDGKRIVTGLGPREFVKLWDARTGEEILTLGRMFGMVTSVAFSPDGNKILATSQLGEIKVWDATPLSKAK
jgi:eukaryotic-like serine/threonine-protein kinase